MRVRAGKNRKPWRIREWLEERGLSLSDVGQEIGVSRQLMSDTARGVRNNQKALTKLRDMGCPDKYLDLPENLKKREVM
ncbi:hypothetical protein JCM15519_35780 [Fundidesulfovibrio butyratiphilus]